MIDHLITFKSQKTQIYTTKIIDIYEKKQKLVHIIDPKETETNLSHACDRDKKRFRRCQNGWIKATNGLSEGLQRVPRSRPDRRKRSPAPTPANGNELPR